MVLIYLLNGQRLYILSYYLLILILKFLGYLQYIDVSMGKEISICHTNEKGLQNVLTHNPSNGMVHLGHANGTVTLWTPNQKSFVAKMLCHRVSIKFSSIKKYCVLLKKILFIKKMISIKKY